MSFLKYSLALLLPALGVAAPLPVTVSIPPQKYFVERVAGDAVRVQVMVGPGDSPATYEPKPSQLRALAASTLYFRIGVPFEDAWMERLRGANPDLRIVDTTAGISRLPLSAGAGPHHEEAHADPHLWLSPTRVSKQAAILCDALCDQLPGQAQTFRENLRRFQSELHQLDQHIRDELKGLEGRTFLVVHPAWGYLAHDYGLKMLTVEVGGQEPSPAELIQCVRQARAAGVRTVFVQPGFSAVAAKTLARELGGQVRYLDPLAENWMENMLKVTRALRQALAFGETGAGHELR